MFFAKPEVSVSQNNEQNYDPKFQLLIPDWIRKTTILISDRLVEHSFFLSCWLRLEPTPNFFSILLQQKIFFRMRQYLSAVRQFNSNFVEWRACMKTGFRFFFDSYKDNQL
jgi:hypothetical protein